MAHKAALLNRFTIEGAPKTAWSMRWASRSGDRLKRIALKRIRQDQTFTIHLFGNLEDALHV